MKSIGTSVLKEMQGKLGVELLGAASVKDSRELKARAAPLLPGVKSVVVLGKEIYKEVVDLLMPSKGAGEAIAGELLGPHNDFLSGRLTRAA